MDYYQTLGIGKNASPDEIKKAYRKLASQHHPDKGGDTAIFQQIEEAYRTLSDPQKKQQYDNPMNHGAHGFPGGFSFNVNGFDFQDIFGAMFGQAQSPFHTRNSVFRTALNVSLQDVYNGSSQSIRIQTNNESKFITVEIPKGIQNGAQIRYDNVLDNGILIIEFRIMPDLHFERRGNDLYTNQRISVLDLIAGTTLTCNTISGKTLEINIKPKTQPQTHLKIPGEGMPVQGTNIHGDQIIILNPYMPDIIDEAITQSILQARSK